MTKVTDFKTWLLEQQKFAREKALLILQQQREQAAKAKTTQK